MLIVDYTVFYHCALNFLLLGLQMASLDYTLLEFTQEAGYLSLSPYSRAKLKIPVEKVYIGKSHTLSIYIEAYFSSNCPVNTIFLTNVHLLGILPTFCVCNWENRIYSARDSTPGEVARQER